MHDTVLVVDFGAQYAQLIARRVREAKVYSEIVPHTVPVAQLLARRPAAIILSGGPASVYTPGAPQVDAALLTTGVPTFGICYGFQAMALALGGKVARTGLSEFGRTTVDVDAGGTLLAGLPKDLTVWMSHGDAVTSAPDGFAVLARTTGAPVAAFEDTARGLAGVQWHPEVLHTERGQAVLEHFLFEIAHARPTWTMVNIVEGSVQAIRSRVGGKRVICGLSGGVDSAVAAALVQRAVGDQLSCVFVDHGLLRAGEAEQVETDFVAATGVDLHVVDATERFLEALAGVADPEQKRKIIGREFIRAFERAAREIGAEGEDVEFLVQGTLYPDVVESGGGEGAANIISRSRWWSRCARCSRTRSVRSASSLACPPRSSGGIPSLGRGWPSGSSGRSLARAWTSSAGRISSRAKSSPGPGWTATSGSSPSSCWPTSDLSASRAMNAPTGTRSFYGPCPARTR